VLLAHVDTVEDPVAAASAISLRYVTDDQPGIRRKRRGKSFAYTAPDGRVIREARTLARIRALAIPPAWTDVWIATDPEGHIQATGRDARGRKQYRYHPRWTQVRDATKYHRLVEFCRALPKIRAAVDRDLACKCLCKEKVLATIVSLMEKAQLRVGNEEYTRENGSYGATTLRSHHAKFHGATLELAYRAKSGIHRNVVVRDAKLTRIVRQCHDLPGKRLFQYIGDDGDVHPVTSADVNDYLRAVSGGPFTAKDYRTWAATMGAALLLCAVEHPGNDRACKRCIKQALEQVANRLGHTVSICRASYVHPRLLDDFTGGQLGKLAKRIRGHVLKHAGDFANIDVAVFRAIEPAVARYLSGT
jgi:DNA topoisomerase-1